MNTPITEHTVALARTHFADNLLAAWVGGSYARGTAKPTSDVDTVVILRAPDHPAERGFAEAFRALHQQAGLKFDHVGEVFDLATLHGLLDFTERCLSAVPAIQHSACYLADCPLSAFRKGDVVFKMLEEPKIFLHDPGMIVDRLTARARDYFLRWPMPRVQPHKNALALPDGSRAAALAETWAHRAETGDWVDTPVGIGLHRWFGPDLAVRARAFDRRRPVTAAVGRPHACPRLVADTDLNALLSAQCLSVPAAVTANGDAR
ncbi:nucleotidyltransferase domain-containing protein [Nocardia takedensis]|uniref:nucleotidyltransferase domain-containing protein n=1 Tax=Nocardia takedensis TaxID=259390 RepID=UPI003F76E7CF